MGGQKQAQRHRKTGDTDVIGYADVGTSNTNHPAALTIVGSAYYKEPTHERHSASSVPGQKVIRKGTLRKDII